MKKSYRLLVGVLMGGIFAAALSGCISIIPADQPAWGASFSGNLLIPYRAAAIREVYQYDQTNAMCEGYMVPTKAETQMVTVLFEPQGDVIAAADLAWQVRDEEGSIYDPIGFGGPNQELIVTYGMLTEGDISDLTGGDSPLVALVYLLPRTFEGLMLIDPQGREGPLQFSNVFEATPEQVLASFRVSAGANINKSCPSGPGYILLPTLP